MRWLSSVLNENFQSVFQHFPFEGIQVRLATAHLTPLFELPFSTTNDHNDHVQIGLIPLDLGFWIITFLLLCCQSAVNTVVALITYEYLLPTTTRHKQNHFLIGYGIVVPTLILGPLVICQYWQPPNIALMLTLLGAIPVVLTLRVIEAMHGKLPDYCQQDRKMLCLYFSSTLLLLVHDGIPVPFTRKIFLQKIGHFISVFVQTSLILSLLQATDYQVFPTHHSSWNLLHWGNLGNTFLLASLTSLVLDGGATGLGILTSCVTGYTLDTFSESPLTKSTSPSDFWGHRWDRPVQSALKRGCYAPLRDIFSTNVAAGATFVVSGVLHEYVLLIYTCRGGQHSYQPRFGRQFLFFVWNGTVMMLERYWKKWTQGSSFFDSNKSGSSSMWRWVSRPLQTALVLMTVLPIGHWFTDEYIRASFYNDVSWGFPILVPLGTPPRSAS